MKHKFSIIFIIVCFISVCFTRDENKIVKDVGKSDPELTWFDGNDKGYEEIDENAFMHCDKLIYIELDDNNWQKIPQKTFKDKGLNKLDILWISGGNIPGLDLDLTDLKQLEWLIIRNMSINVLPSKTFDGLENLIYLFLQSNNLFDIDIEGILQFTPKLKKIYLNDNIFKCSRLSEIIPYLKNKNVEPRTYIWNKRQRNYTPQKINNIGCLSDDQWRAEIKANGLEHYALECLKGQAECNTKPEVKSVTKSETVLSFKNLTNKQFENVFNKIDAETTFLNETIKYYFINLKTDVANLVETLENYHSTQAEKFESLNGKLEFVERKISALQENFNEIIKTLKNMRPVRQVKECPRFCDNCDKN
jgi:hypothetical protein